MHVTEKLKHDIKCFPLRMLRAQLLNAERWEPKTGGLEEKVRLLRLRHAELSARLGVINVSSSKQTKTQVSRQTDQRNGSSERLPMRLTKKA